MLRSVFFRAHQRQASSRRVAQDCAVLRQKLSVAECVKEQSRGRDEEDNNGQRIVVRGAHARARVSADDPENNKGYSEVNEFK
jgi:hypothetical protein